MSRRAVLEESRAEQRTELIAGLKEGQVLNGVVKNITDYGAFIDLGGVDGLLHVTDLSYSRVKKTSDLLSIGQTIKCKIICNIIKTALNRNDFLTQIKSNTKLKSLYE